MSTKYVKWHKNEDLEKIAEAIHRDFECTPPVDIDYIAEMMGLEILDIHRLKEDFGVYGLLGKVKGNYTIYIQKGSFDITNYNTNLTIAEELAHFVLHKKYFDDVQDIDEAHDFYTKIKEKSEAMMEFNAKHLAGAILVPKDDLIKQAEKLFKKHKLQILDIAQNDPDIVIDYIATRLTDYYRVPDIAISYRLKRKITGFKDFVIEECSKKII